MREKPDADSRLEDALRGEIDNYPGAAYVGRVATAIGRMWSSQTEGMNDAWEDIRKGRFKFAQAMELWARTIENSYDVFVEIAQGPGFSSRPAWLVIPYYPDKPKMNRPPDWSYQVAVEGPSEDSGVLDYSKFIGVAKTAYDLYQEAPMRSGTRVVFKLKDGELKRLEPDTDYLSFIFRQGQGPSSPLAIIVLRVKKMNAADMGTQV